MSLEEGKRDKTTTSRHRNPPGSEHGARLGDYVAASGRVQPVARLPRHDDSGKTGTGEQSQRSENLVL